MGRFSSDGRHIVYQRLSDAPDGTPTIHIMDADGQNDREIPALAGTRPQWLYPSPDNTRLAYVSMTRDASGLKIQLVTMTIDGRDPRVASETGGFAAEWSPDSRSLLFADLPKGFVPGTMGVSLVNVDGTDMVQLSSGLPTLQSGAWSPDGARVIFSVPTPSGSALMIANRDGSGRRSLVDGPKHQAFPVWSRDGRRIAFFGGDSVITPSMGVGLQRLFVVNSDGSGLQQVLADAYGVSGLSFSLDGRKLLFADRRMKRASNIFVMDVDGSHERELIGWPGTDELPVWSPDGKSILFQSSEDPQGRSPHIFIMRADGTNVRRLR